MTVLENAIGVMLDATRSIHGAEVTYARGGTSATIKDAVQGATLKDVIDMGGPEILVETTDFLIKVDRLSALFGPPEPGDIITRIIGDTTMTWTVETRRLATTPWDWSDTARTTYRITCRKDGDAAFEVSVPTGFDLAGDEVRGP